MKTKITTVFALFLLLLFNDYKSFSQLIDDEAFSQSVVNDISYTILGEVSPTSGARLDVSNKLEGTVNIGMPTQYGAFSLDFGAGFENNNFQFFSDEKFKSYFLLQPTFHVIFATGNSNKFMYGKEYIKEQIGFKKEQKDILLDSIKKLQVLLKLKYPDAINDTYDAFKLKETEDTILLKTYDINPLTYLDCLVEDSIQFCNFMANYIDSRDPIKIDSTVYKYIKKTNFLTNKLFKDFIAKIKAYESWNKTFVNYQIQLANPHWTSKKNTWLSISPIVKSESFELLKTGSFEREDENFITLGANVKGHRYYENKRITFYGNLSLGLSYGNNLQELTKNDYRKIDTLGISNNTIITNEKKGNVYTGKFQEGLVKRIDAEFYLFPNIKYFPGFYFSPTFLESNIYKNNQRLRTEGGLVISVKSKDKENSWLYIKIYSLFENVLKQKNDAGDKFGLKDQFSMGIRLGLPIYLNRPK